MKNILSLLFSLFFVANINAQKEEGETASESLKVIKIDSTAKKWGLGGNVGFYATQVAFVNWAAGGLSSVSGIAKGDIFAKYRNLNHFWDTDFKVEYGIILNQGQDLLKNTDLFELNSSYGYQIDKKGKIFLGSLLKFSSQFTEGKTPEDTVYTTNFLAPARLVLALGLNWKPNKYFSVFFSPAAGKFTFVTDKGVDETKFGLEKGKELRTEFGAYLKIKFEKEIFKNLNAKSTLTLFNNFLDNSQDTVYTNNIQELKSNRANIDIDWILGLDFIFSKWLTFNINTQLIYDHDIKVLLTEKDNLTPILNNDGTQKYGPRTQFTESLNIGLTYRFKPKEKEKVKK